MDEIHFRRKLFLFFSLISISTSFIKDEKGSVAFVGNKLYYNGNKKYLFIICNSSYFNKIGNYNFKISQSFKTYYNYFTYTFSKHPLKNYTYDYLNSLSFDYTYSKIKEEYSFINSTIYNYIMTFKVEKTFENLIIKIPIETNTNINIYSSSVEHDFWDDIKEFFYKIWIIFLIILGIWMLCCLYICCRCCGCIGNSSNNNNNVNVNNNVNYNVKKSVKKNKTPRISRTPMPIQAPEQLYIPNEPIIINEVYANNPGGYFIPSPLNSEENIYVPPGNQGNGYY